MRIKLENNKIDSSECVENCTKFKKCLNFEESFTKTLYEFVLLNYRVSTKLK